MQRLFIDLNQTAHISLQILAMSNSVEDKKNTERPNLRRAPPFNL